MRPVTRGTSPTGREYDNYRDAVTDLVGRMGRYCSYCERCIPTQLAVEHVQPKGLPAYAHLVGTWDNFLLGCVNCNSTKGDKDVLLDRVCLPDRDNTFAAYTYTPDGRIEPAPGLTNAQTGMALGTLSLTGLDKRISQVRDENGRLIAIDRVSQRMEVLLIARRSLTRLLANPIDPLREQIVDTALAHGFFSIWMNVFEQDAEMRRRFIMAFPGTALDCFDGDTLPVSPRPNNGLAHAAKI